jgi:hypothetical protein
VWEFGKILDEKTIQRKKETTPKEEDIINFFASYNEIKEGKEN